MTDNNSELAGMPRTQETTEPSPTDGPHAVIGLEAHLDSATRGSLAPPNDPGRKRELDMHPLIYKIMYAI